MRVAFSYMQMNHGERIEYLKKLFDAKLDRKGAVNRVEHGISNEELKHLAMKMGLPEQEVSRLNVQFRLYDFDGSETLDLEEAFMFETYLKIILFILFECLLNFELLNKVKVNAGGEEHPG